MIVIGGHRLFICRCVKDLGHCVYWSGYAPFPTNTCKETLSDLGDISVKIAEFLSYLMMAI
jgi:hypothetical protein